MGKINYEAIYNKNKHDWHALTEEPQKYEALLAGHYSESNHFVYELLQNAEDERASHVVFEYYSDKLIFYHNGKPFDEDDVRGVSSMLMGTKDRDDAQTIGRFGMGFKSVFKYTDQPEIHSDDEGFVIKNYLLPVKAENGWNFRTAKQFLKYPAGGGWYTPFANDEHLTRIIIPFRKRNRQGEIVSVDGQEVLDKLQGLSGEILLFLTWIQDLYWINKRNGQFVHITLSQAPEDQNLITCRMIGSDTDGKEEITRYLKYRKVFDHPEMRSAEVCVAYKVNAQVKNINEVDDAPVWVYFPTRDHTDLPFLIHGSFETAVSREKLMTPSKFNEDLFDKLGDLIAETMQDLSDRGLITQVFLRRILIAAFQDEEENKTIPGLKEKVTKVFREGAILPDRKGNGRRIEELSVPVPFGMADLKDLSFFRDAFTDAGFFVAFNNERERNFTEYFIWLINDLHVRQFNLILFAERLEKSEVLKNEVVNDGQLEELKTFYGFLSDFRESLYERSYSYTRAGFYEQVIRRSLTDAWEMLRKAPIILNADNRLVPAFLDGNPNVYLSASSSYRKIMNSAIVSPKMAQDFRQLFEDGFRIGEFDNLQYIKEKVLRKYVIGEGDNIGFEDREHLQDEYAEDIRQILELTDGMGASWDTASLFKDAYIIKVFDPKGRDLFALPEEAYLPVSDEGADLDTYFAPVFEIYEEDEPDEEDNPVYTKGEPIPFPRSRIDTAFYEERGIPIAKLKKLGIVTSPFKEGVRAEYGTGDGYWHAIGDFCPNLELDGLRENLEYISTFPEDELAKKKSEVCLKLLLSASTKMKGEISRRKNNPYREAATSYHLLLTVKYHDWLYDKEGEVHQPLQLSRYDLNEGVYHDLPMDKEAFATLGFIEKEADSRADAFEKVSGLDRRDKAIMFRQLARELGYDLSSLEGAPSSAQTDDADDTEEEGTFDPNAWVSDEFPQRRVRSIESLIQHVREQFFCADPVRYEKVLRQIRTSKSPKVMRAYALGMYTNDSDVHICQMCRKPAPFVEVTEIANYGLEMPQLNLCLCKNCASRYKQFRDGSKEKFKTEMTRAIRSIDIEEEAGEYEVDLSPNESIFFTQTHLAEVKEILGLLSEYGLPGQEEADEKPKTKSARGAGQGSDVGSQRDFYEQSMNDLRAAMRQSSRGEGIQQSSAPAPSQGIHSKGIQRRVLSPSQKPEQPKQQTRQPERKLISSGGSSSAKPHVGAKVLHKSFGQGTITELDAHYVSVQFDRVGEKELSYPMVFQKGILKLIEE